MSVSRRGLDALMAQQATDDGEGEPGAGGEAREAVPQVVKANVMETGRLTQRAPRLLQVDQMCAGVAADDDVRVLLFSRQAHKDVQGRGIERDDLGPVLIGLVALQDQLAVVQVHAGPLQGQDLADAAAGEDQQADGRRRIAVDGAFSFLGFDLLQERAEFIRA